jgi:flavin reductase (DIM6/NTAB) family NADH-FMN oxidoreductase RutF
MTRTIKPPHPAESAFSMECVLAHHYVMINPDTGKPSGTVILGTVKRFHIKESVLDTEDPGIRLLTEKLRPVSRLGGITYGRTLA